MKKFFKHTSIICFLMIGLTACLDLQPIDKNSTTGFNQDAVFAKCYASLALSGQQGATGQGDVHIFLQSICEHAHINVLPIPYVLLHLFCNDVDDSKKPLESET